MPTALITGAGSGIGRAIALKLAELHHTVVLAGRTLGKLEETAAEVRRAGGQARAIPTDVTKPDHVDRLVHQTLKAHGEINVLINAAGHAPMIPTPDITTAQWHEILDSNLSSVFYACRAVWPHMQRQYLEHVADHRTAHGQEPLDRNANTGGIIINFSSMASRDPFPGLGAYAVAKIGVNMLTQVLAKEGEPLGIRVHAIAPAAVETPMLRSLFPADQLPTSEILHPAEVADLAAALITGPLQFTSGETLFLHRRV